MQEYGFGMLAFKYRLERVTAVALFLYTLLQMSTATKQTDPVKITIFGAKSLRTPTLLWYTGKSFSLPNPLHHQLFPNWVPMEASTRVMTRIPASTFLMLTLDNRNLECQKLLGCMKFLPIVRCYSLHCTKSSVAVTLFLNLTTRKMMTQGVLVVSTPHLSVQRSQPSLV